MAKPDDPFSRLELLIGLPNVRVLSVDRVEEVLEIHRWPPTLVLEGNWRLSSIPNPTRHGHQTPRPKVFPEEVASGPKTRKLY